MEKTLTLAILLILFVLVVVFLSYLFIQYVKENVDLIRNLNWKVFWQALFWRPRFVFFFIAGFAMGGWAIKEMLLSSGTRWRMTKATLSNAILNERKVNDVSEEFITAAYEFRVNGSTYEAYDEVSRYSFMSVEKQIAEVKSLYKTKDVFYNADNPHQTHFNERYTGMSQYIAVLFASLFFMLFSYWMVMEAYKHKLLDN